MRAGAPTGANAAAGKKLSMLFPFGPEQPCATQYSAAHRIKIIHSAAIANATYLRMRILIAAAIVGSTAREQH
jgi:hypothetical protein